MSIGAEEAESIVSMFGQSLGCRLNVDWSGGGRVNCVNVWAIIGMSIECRLERRRQSQLCQCLGNHWDVD